MRTDPEAHGRARVPRLSCVDLFQREVTLHTRRELGVDDARACMVSEGVHVVQLRVAVLPSSGVGVWTVGGQHRGPGLGGAGVLLRHAVSESTGREEGEGEGKRAGEKERREKSCGVEGREE